MQERGSESESRPLSLSVSRGAIEPTWLRSLYYTATTHSLSLTHTKTHKVISFKFHKFGQRQNLAAVQLSGTLLLFYFFSLLFSLAMRRFVADKTRNLVRRASTCSPTCPVSPRPHHPPSLLSQPTSPPFSSFHRTRWTNQASTRAAAVSSPPRLAQASLCDRTTGSGMDTGRG